MLLLFWSPYIARHKLKSRLKVSPETVARVGGGGDSQKIWVRVCGTLTKTLVSLNKRGKGEKSQNKRGGGGGGGGGYPKKFYTGRPRPDVQPLTLLYTIFFRKGTPFVYLLLEKGTPFICLRASQEIQDATDIQLKDIEKSTSFICLAEL